MENAVNVSTAGSSGQVVVAGAGYAGLHVALRLTVKLRDKPTVELTLVDRHDYHQVLTELPRVAGGTRAADAVRIPLQDMLATRVRFVQTDSGGWRPWGSAVVGPRESSWPASWPRCCPRWPAAAAWRATGPPCCSSRPAPPSWPAPHRS